MSNSRQRLAGIGAALRWVEEITVVGLEMALPAWFGYWLDQRWQTEPWLVCVGAVLGFVAGMQHLLSMVARRRSQGQSLNNISQSKTTKSNGNRPE